MKKFKTRKKHRFFKILLIIIFIYIFYKLSSIIMKSDVINPQKYINYLVNEGLNNQIDKVSYYNNNPINLLENNLSLTFNDKNNDVLVNYIDKVNKNSDYLIYIYNTHESEEYKIEYKYDYSIVPNVKIASYILQESLSNYNINSYVEVNSIKKILDDNNWIYRDSYKASRILLESNKNYKYYIDIHRDSSNYDKTTINVNNNTYARVMFVVGLEYNTYEYNLDIANKLSDMLNNKVNGISRGVLKKEGLGVNGIYNQDFSPNLLLIEIGGVDNNILEVSNTIGILASVLNDYIKDDNI